LTSRLIEEQNAFKASIIYLRLNDSRPDKMLHTASVRYRSTVQSLDTTSKAAEMIASTLNTTCNLLN
jgi:hypothetical protein